MKIRMLFPEDENYKFYILRVRGVGDSSVFGDGRCISRTTLEEERAFQEDDLS